MSDQKGSGMTKIELPPQPKSADYDGFIQLGKAMEAWKEVCRMIIESRGDGSHP